MCDYVFFYTGKQFAHSNLNILHSNKISGPQVECFHRSLESQRVQSQVKAPVVMCLSTGIAFALHPSWQGLDKTPQSLQNPFQCVCTGAKGVTPAQRHIPEVLYMVCSCCDLASLCSISRGEKGIFCFMG